MSATNPDPPSPKWVKEQTKSKPVTGTAPQTATKSSVDEPVSNSTSPGVSKRMQASIGNMNYILHLWAKHSYHDHSSSELSARAVTCYNLVCLTRLNVISELACVDIA